MLTVSEPALMLWTRTAAPTDSETSTSRPRVRPCPLPEEIALFIEVDAILCDAAARLTCRQRPAPPATGRALRGPRAAGRAWLEPSGRWRVPPHAVRAVQRGPPAHRTDQHRREEVMSSQQ